jgi:hypothetical protein
MFYCILKSAVFWDIILYSPLKVNRCFGGTYRLHFGSKNKLSRKLAWRHLVSRACLFFNPEDGDYIFPENTFVRTSDPTKSNFPLVFLMMPLFHGNTVLVCSHISRVLLLTLFGVHLRTQSTVTIFLSNVWATKAYCTSSISVSMEICHLFSHTICVLCCHGILLNPTSRTAEI